MKPFFVFGIALMFGLLLSGCNSNDAPAGFKALPGGSKIKIYTGKTDRPAPSQGDIYQIHLQYYSSTDSLLFDSRGRNRPIIIQLAEPAYSGDLMDGLALLNEGDSATLLVRADSFFLAGLESPVPDFIDPKSDIRFEISVLKVRTESEFTAELQLEKAQLAQSEIVNIEAWLKETELPFISTESGMYYHELETGTGKTPQPGDTVVVHYTGMLLDGTIFDTSLEGGQPFRMAYGHGQVIPGWEEGIGYLNKGSRAILVIPSELAYQDQEIPGTPIRPFSTLVFEVQIMDIL